MAEPRASQEREDDDEDNVHEVKFSCSLPDGLPIMPM